MTRPLSANELPELEIVLISIQFKLVRATDSCYHKHYIRVFRLIKKQQLIRSKTDVAYKRYSKEETTKWWPYPKCDKALSQKSRLTSHCVIKHNWSIEKNAPASPRTLEKHTAKHSKIIVPPKEKQVTEKELFSTSSSVSYSDSESSYLTPAHKANCDKTPISLDTHVEPPNTNPGCSKELGGGQASAGKERSAFFKN